MKPGTCIIVVTKYTTWSEDEIKHTVSYVPQSWGEISSEVLWKFLIGWNHFQEWGSFSLFFLEITVAYYMPGLAKWRLENQAKRITEKLTLSNILLDLLNCLNLNHLTSSCLFCDFTIKNAISFTEVFHTSNPFSWKITVKGKWILNSSN